MEVRVQYEKGEMCVVFKSTLNIIIAPLFKYSIEYALETTAEGHSDPAHQRGQG